MKKKRGKIKVLTAAVENPEDIVQYEALHYCVLHDALINLKFTREIRPFASRLKKKFFPYCSYRPDPEAMCVEAFSIS